MEDTYPIRWPDSTDIIRWPDSIDDNYVSGVSKSWIWTWIDDYIDNFTSNEWDKTMELFEDEL